MTEELRKLVETPCGRDCERNSIHVKRFMLGRFSLFGTLCCGNSMMGDVRKLVETPSRRNCERKSKHVTRFMILEFSLNTLFWEFNDIGSK